MALSPSERKTKVNIQVRHVEVLEEPGTRQAYIVTSDNAALATLGYKQEFKRAFSPIEVFALAFSLIGLFPSLSSVLIFAIPNGGPAAMVWGWAVCTIFLMPVALALAELASAAPTSGGLYYWTWSLAAPEWRKLLSWVVGYSNSMGLIAGLASVDWGCAVQLMAAATIGTDGSFVATTGQTFAVFVALLACHGFVSSLATSVVARLQGVFVAFNILLCLTVIIALPAATPVEYRNSASYVFGGYANFYGWPDGFAFILSFLAPLWTYGGFDAALHISEEAANARTAVPWAMVGSAGIAGILGWVINITIAFCMGTDLESIVENPIGQPMATILFNSLGRKGALVVWSVVAFVQIIVGSNVLTTASRQTFAFARDRGLPFWRFIYRMNPHTQTPVNAVWVCVLVAFFIGLLAFAGPTANSAIFSIGVVGQYTAFAIPIACRFLGGMAYKPGPFTLGRFGLPIAVMAVAWMVFSIVIIAFPTTPRPDANEMNYMVVVYGGWIGLCLVYYYIPVYGGACWYNGPRTTLEEGEEAEAAGIDRLSHTSEKRDV